jgi:hypothetical protein
LAVLMGIGVRRARRRARRNCPPRPVPCRI